jgi:predicted nucleic acid-binding protein
MDILLDTNILARCIQPSHALHATAVAAMQELSARRERLCIVPQILYEHFVVCTRPPGEYGGLGMSNEAAIAEIARVISLAELLSDSSAIYPEWLKLIEKHKIAGKRGHDARLVAAMNIHGISAIATFNRKDFVPYGRVQVLSPEELSAAWTSREANAG